MTVAYAADVASAKFGIFPRLIFRWRGSIWKAVYMELILWCVGYISISLLYRFAFTPEQQSVFERVVAFFREHKDFLPLTFMLRFYVSIVVARWWAMYCDSGWIDYAALHIRNYIPGNDEETIMARRNIVRHLLFAQVIIYRDISVLVRKRFPTMGTLVAAGYITNDELAGFEAIDTQHSKYFVPIHWAMSIVARLRAEGRIASDITQDSIYQEFMKWRRSLGTLLMHDSTPVPLLYTQVVCIVVRLYFVLALCSSQFLLHEIDDQHFVEYIDIGIPVHTIFSFVFYMGWLKVAEALLNPFGSDDDDFESNYLLDRNMETAYQIVSGDLYEPPIIKDIHWGQSRIDPLYNISVDLDSPYGDVHPSQWDVPPPTSPVCMAPKISSCRFSNAFADSFQSRNFCEQIELDDKNEVPVFVDHRMSVVSTPELGFRRRKFSVKPVEFSLGNSPPLEKRKSFFSKMRKTSHPTPVWPAEDRNVVSANNLRRMSHDPKLDMTIGQPLGLRASAGNVNFGQTFPPNTPKNSLKPPMEESNTRLESLTEEDEQATKTQKELLQMLREAQRRELEEEAEEKEEEERKRRQMQNP
ncbi:unnamed protein product, partial [Mesorhabditis spiculigera]